MPVNESPFLQEPLVEIVSGTKARPADLANRVTNADDPQWGVAQAFFIWVTSVVLLIIVPGLAVVPYVIYRALVFGSQQSQPLLADKNFIFLSILAVLPTHLLSLLLVWFVVTNSGRRPFWQSLGWSWPANFGPGKSVLLASALLGVGLLITRVFGGGETQLDHLINSSYGARVATAFLAVATGPLVEELIYRGVLYSALQRAIGMLWAVVVVSVLFAGVHVFQYYNNFAVIAVITMLSVALTLIRALTGRLLPSFIVHLIFNGIQSLFLVLQPFFQNFIQSGPQKPAISFLFHSLARHFG